MHTLHTSTQPPRHERDTQLVVEGTHLVKAEPPGKKPTEGENSTAQTDSVRPGDLILTSADRPAAGNARTDARKISGGALWRFRRTRGYAPAYVGAFGSAECSADSEHENKIIAPLMRKKIVAAAPPPRPKRLFPSRCTLRQTRSTTLNSIPQVVRPSLIGPNLGWQSE